MVCRFVLRHAPMMAASPPLLNPSALEARAGALIKTPRFAAASSVYRRRVLAAYAADPTAHAACSDLGRFALISMTVRKARDGQAFPSHIAAIMAAAGFASARRTTVLIARLRDQGLIADRRGAISARVPCRRPRDLRSTWRSGWRPTSRRWMFWSLRARHESGWPLNLAPPRSGWAPAQTFT